MSKFELNDVDLDDLGKSSEEIEEILEGGDEDAIEELLGFDDEPKEESKEEEVKKEEITPLEVDGDKKPGEHDAGKQGDNDGTPPDADQQNEPDKSDEGMQFVESRDGKHKIPYEVLQAARDRANSLQNCTTELEQDLTGTKAELDQLQTLNDQLKQQLQDNNLTPGEVLKQADIDDATLEALGEYGDIGEVVRALALQNKQLQDAISKGQEEPGSQTKESESEPDVLQQQVETAIANNPSLSDWRENDPDKWDMATIVDNQLRQDPTFKNASFEDRFNEVVKRTQAAFGIPDIPALGSEAEDKELADKAKEKVEEASKQQHPQSLSDLGQAPTAQKSRADTFAEMSESQLESALANMSQDQIEELMAELGE
ncbi:hypothetical protein [Microbulbifer sp. GL-2]|uniref:hypothetical protein n=1 Tax=Microbulbifer sp. GL-2 TaxID=2591606 RepID=UPI001164B1E2|nr:hypothetical protein [Microbulbifer sp. GL-2]BBM03791.1 hypothetical protein GL2_38650 [Microbulbifer sp. GL-2]